MKLQEILDTASPRPWWYDSDVEAICGGDSDDPIDIIPIPWGHTAAVGLVIQAVNNFERLLEAAKAVLPFLPGDVVTKTKPKHVQAAQALREAIRQTEKVAT